MPFDKPQPVPTPKFHKKIEMIKAIRREIRDWEASDTDSRLKLSKNIAEKLDELFIIEEKQEVRDPRIFRL